MRIKTPKETLKGNDLLTISRIFMIPLMLLCFHAYDTSWHKTGMIIFILAWLTDFLDGYYARLFRTESKLGAVLDPLADKWMALASLIMLIHLDQIDNLAIISVYIILFREIAVMGLRSVFNKLAIIGSSKLGKIKSMIVNCAIFLYMISMVYGYKELISFANSTLLFSGLLAIISGARYFISARDILKNKT